MAKVNLHLDEKAKNLYRVFYSFTLFNRTCSMSKSEKVDFSEAGTWPVGPKGTNIYRTPAKGS